MLQHAQQKHTLYTFLDNTKKFQNIGTKKKWWKYVQLVIVTTEIIF